MGSINKNFGKLKNNQIIYAPTSFKIDGGIIISPPEEFYLKKGWYKIIDTKPEPESNCYVQFKDYTVDDQNKTITVNYSQIMIPVTKEIHMYSKLKLEMAMFNLGKTDMFDDFLRETTLSNDFGQEIELKRLYDIAQDLKDDNVYFETYLKKAEEYLGIDSQTAMNILSNCLID